MVAYHIWWVSKDGKASISGGSYDTRSKAEAQIPQLKSELLDICASDEEKAVIESGFFELDVKSRLN